MRLARRLGKRSNCCHSPRRPGPRQPQHGYYGENTTWSILARRQLRKGSAWIRASRPCGRPPPEQACLQYSEQPALLSVCYNRCPGSAGD